MIEESDPEKRTDFVSGALKEVPVKVIWVSTESIMRNISNPKQSCKAT